MNQAVTNLTAGYAAKLEEGKKHFLAQQGLFIGGEWCAPARGQYFENTTPIDGSKINDVAIATQEDVDAAVKAARDAQPAWAELTPAMRAQIFLNIAKRIEENLETLSLVESIENGKAIREPMAADIPLAIEHFSLGALDIRSVNEAIETTLENGMRAMNRREPLGVIGACKPFNFPMLMPIWGMVPALLTGNTMVVKIAEQTPASFMVFIKAIADLLPAGVINVLTGEAESGIALTSHNDLDKLIFTGSTAVGKEIMKAAADKIIPATVELGGKSPVIIMADAWNNGDADRRAQLVEGALLAFFNAGEVCTCGSRLMVEESIYEEYMAAVLDTMQTAVVRGHPLDPNTTVGAQVDKNQYDRIQSYLKLAKEEGAEILTGGDVHVFEGELESLNNGYYIQATFLKWPDNSSRCMQEEIFGPVVGVVTFKDADDALAIANDTNFGLGASIWTDDELVYQKLMRGIKAGRIWKNTHHIYNWGAAFGGYKDSGVGRDTYKGGFEAFTQVKSEVINDNRAPLGFYVAKS